MVNARTVVLALGLLLSAAGLIGFVNHPVFAVFAVNGPHNFIHVVPGLLAIGSALRGEGSARRFARAFGVAYGLIALFGLVVPGDFILGVIEDNFADDLLHAVVAAAFLYVGYTGSRAGDGASPAAPPPNDLPA